MIRSVLVSAVLLTLPSCDAIGKLFGGESESRANPKEQEGLPVSRNAGKVPSDDPQRPLELEVGQWTRHVILHRGGETTEYFRQVVAEESRGFRVEIVNGRPDAGTVIQLLVAGEASGNELLHIVSAKVRMPSGIIREISGPAMDATRSGYQRLLSDVRLGTTWSGTPSEVEVRAGDFAGCNEVPLLKEEFAGIETLAKAYYHPRVPIGGLVKGVNADGRTVVELTGFGTDGAQSVIERQRRAR